MQVEQFPMGRSIDVRGLAALFPENESLKPHNSLPLAAVPPQASALRQPAIAALDQFADLQPEYLQKLAEIFVADAYVRSAVRPVLERCGIGAPIKFGGAEQASYRSDRIGEDRQRAACKQHRAVEKCQLIPPDALDDLGFTAESDDFSHGAIGEEFRRQCREAAAFAPLHRQNCRTSRDI